MEQFQVAHKNTLQTVIFYLNVLKIIIMYSLCFNYFQLLNSIDSQSLFPNVEPQKKHNSIFGPVVSNGYSNIEINNFSTTMDGIIIIIIIVLLIYFFFVHEVYSLNQKFFILNILDNLDTEDNKNCSGDQNGVSPASNNHLSSDLKVSGKFNLFFFFLLCTCIK